MATITAFYDLQRKGSPDFFIYPDYFVFHAGCHAGDYSMMDVWPNHKSVQVDDNPEEILRTINDRAVNLLVVPTAKGRENQIQRQTRNSALVRIKLALLYRKTRRIEGADLRIDGNPRVEAYVEDVIRRTPGLSEEDRATLLAKRRASLENGRASEWYRRIPTEEAIRHL